jgi:hypothetical protein
MLDFRKILLALSVAGLLVGTASAQCTGVTVPCINQASIPGEGFVAAEGMTELLPPITLTLTNATALTGTVILNLSSNAPFNNQQLANTHTSQIDVSATDNAGDTASSVTQTSATTISITFTSIKGTATSITISGLRSNASALPVGSQVTVNLTSPSIIISAGNTLPINAAYTASSISSVTVAGAPNISTCTVNSTTNPAVVSVGIVNGFPDSLKSAADVGGSATQGTVLAVTFNNLTAGVTYYVPSSVSNGNFAMTAYLSSTATAANIAPVFQGPNPTAASSQVALPASGTIYYGVTGSVNGTEAATINLTAVLPSAGVTTFTSAVPSVSIALVSPTTALDPATAYPEYAVPTSVPTYTQPAPGSGTVTACTSTLLFPYVINVPGFDTGIAITNAQTGKSATSGSCNVTFYGTGNPSTNPYVTPLIPPATSSATNTSLPLGVFDVGTVAPGFEGFVIATCNFQGAHGYAFVSDGLGTGTGIASNYLAVVLTDSAASATFTLTPTAQ